MRHSASSPRTADAARRALSAPHRGAILGLVAHEELSAGQIAGAFGVSRAAVSQHVTVLKNAGLLSERWEGTRRLYRARAEGLEELRRFLEDVWRSALDVDRPLVEVDEERRDRDCGERAG